MDINLELYKVFYYVATTLSFSEASRQLFISQSAVSQAVKNLEKKLGHTLFVRSTKRVILTPEGELLLQHVKPALSMLNEGEAVLYDCCQRRKNGCKQKVPWQNRQGYKELRQRFRE